MENSSTKVPFENLNNYREYSGLSVTKILDHVRKFEEVTEELRKRFNNEGPLIWGRYYIYSSIVKYRYWSLDLDHEEDKEFLDDCDCAECLS